MQSPAIHEQPLAIRSILGIRQPERRTLVTLRFIGTTSENGNCPTLYEVVETGEILVQGDRETAPEHLAQLRDVKPSETFVRILRELLIRFVPGLASPASDTPTKE